MKNRHHTDEAKAKLREDRLGEKHWNYGQSLSFEHRQKLSDAKGNEKAYWYKKHHDDSTKEKLKELNLGENHPNYGKLASVNTKNKRSLSCADKVYEGISSSGEKFTFTNARKFAQQHDLISSKITLCAQGLRPHHKGWRFSILSEENKEPDFYKGLSPWGETFFFGNVKKFADTHDLDRSVITKVCQGKRIQHKGWKFEFTKLYFESN